MKPFQNKRRLVRVAKVIQFPRNPFGVISGGGMTLEEYNASLQSKLEPEKAGLFDGLIMSATAREELENKFFPNSTVKVK